MHFDFWHDHAGISVPDLEAAIDWYQAVLGFSLERRNVLAAVPAQVAMLCNGGLRIELFQPTDGRPADPARGLPDEDLKTWGNKHAGFAVEDVSAVHDELQARGADIVWMKQLPFGGATMFVRDNAGNLLEFIQRERPTIDGGTL